ICQRRRDCDRICRNSRICRKVRYSARLHSMNDQRTTKAVILARGPGTRMRREDSTATHLSSDQSRAADLGMKGMIPIGRPFLDYLLSSIADAGFTKVCLVIGPEHEGVVRHFTIDSPPSRVSIEFAVQEKPLGTADAVLSAETFTAGEPFAVLNSDNYYPSDALAALRHAPPPAIAGFARSALLA